MTKEEFKQRLNKLDLSLKDFSKISNTAYSTIRNWGYKLNKDSKAEVPIPNWVDSMLDYYESNIKESIDLSNEYLILKSKTHLIKTRDTAIFLIQEAAKCRKNKDYKKAKRYYQSAIDLDIVNQFAYTGISSVYLDEGDKKTALEYLQLAEDIKKDEYTMNLRIRLEKGR